MKIRILTQNPLSVGFGGVELQASKYIANIKKIDNAIDIGFFKWEEKDFDILHIIGIHTGINPYWIEVLKKRGIKIIVSSVFYIKPNYLLDYRRPIIYKIFSLIPFHIINWIKQVLNLADIILPNSIEEQKQLKLIFGLDEKKIEVLYNGVDKNYFEGINETIFQDKYKIGDYILCVSHIEPRKNHLSLVKGFLKYKKNTNSDLKLVLLGDYRGNYFDFHKTIKKLIKDNNENIIHINNLSNKDDIFKSAYLGSKAHFLLSSLETPGLSNLEAGLAGIKLIVGDCRPVKEYFGEYAYYINGKNIEEIVGKIKELDKIEKIKDQKQIDFIIKNYTWENIGLNLLDIYKKYAK